MLQLSRAFAGVAALAVVAILVLVDGAVGGSGASPVAGTLTRVCTCPDAYVFDLNDRGDVAWTQQDDPQFSMAYFWRQGGKTRLGLGEATVNDLNDRGQIVGWSDRTHGGFLWANGRFTALAPLRTNTIPQAINERGQIAGTVERQTPNGSQHAFLWQSGKLTDLGTVAGMATSTGSAINERGQVAGESEGKGFLWGNGRLTAIRRPRSDYYVWGLSERGEVWWRGPDGAAFLGRGGKLVDLTRLGGKRSAVATMNGRGQLVGWYRDRRWRTRAFLWQDGRLRDLGTLGGARSEALALNDRGEVAGRSETRAGAWRAFFWRDGTMREVGSFQPLALNDRGQILGRSGHDVVLWTPR